MSCRRVLVALLVVASLVGVGRASGSAGGAVLALSLHSGQVTAGKDFPLPDSAGIDALTGELAVVERSARALAEAVRIRSALGPWDRRVVDGLAVEVDTDRVVIHETAVPPPAPRRDETPIEVQVFGLVGASQVSVRCPGRGVRVMAGVLQDLGPSWARLSDALGRGSSLCAGGAWEVSVSGAAGRPYAGVFVFRPLPDRLPEPGSTRREARARRGSEVIFRTTLSAYVAGVLAAEEAGLRGEAGLALAQVIAHDGRVARHPGRPLCDTTHCQVFLGTAAPRPEVTRALALPALATTRWLPYFRGGNEPWELRRPAAEVHAAMGDAQRFSGDGRVLEVVRSTGIERVSCEPVRARLRLPGCPTEGVFEGETVRIRGRGRGHGVGLDVEAARRSDLTASELLRRAYGL